MITARFSFKTIKPLRVSGSGILAFVPNIECLPPIKYVRIISPYDVNPVRTHRSYKQLIFSDTIHDLRFEITGSGRKYKPVNYGKYEDASNPIFHGLYPRDFYVTMDDFYRDDFLLYKLTAGA